MEHSKYNHIFKLPNEEKYLLYNFMTGAMLELDADGYKRFAEPELLSEAERTMLVDNGFIVDFDELAYLRLGNKLICADEELLSVLIAPTMACNFDCPYCFEHHGSGMMSEEIQDEIIRFVETSIKEHHHKHLFVYWFGGEPLLGIEIIESMSRRLIALAEKYDIAYSSAMATNGYLLTPDVVKILERCKLNRLQITLDGMRETNDKTRILRNGEGSFDTIIGNLRKLHTNIAVHIRTNLNRDNEVEFGQLKSLIREIREQTGADISIYGAHMSVYEFNNKDVSELELTAPQYTEVLKKHNMIGTARRYHTRFAFCDAAKVFSYCFDELGFMYKCWNDIGNRRYAYDHVRNVNRSGQLRLISQNALDYLANSFPEDEECLTCKLLPACMGGCIKKRIVEHKKECSPVRYDIDDYVYKRYLESQGGEIDETGN